MAGRNGIEIWIDISAAHGVVLRKIDCRPWLTTIQSRKCLEAFGDSPLAPAAPICLGPCGTAATIKAMLRRPPSRAPQKAHLFATNRETLCHMDVIESHPVSENKDPCFNGDCAADASASALSRQLAALRKLGANGGKPSLRHDSGFMTHEWSAADFVLRN